MAVVIKMVELAEAEQTGERGELWRPIDYTPRNKSPCEPITIRHPLMAGVKMELKNSELWEQFHGHTTEMIITKSGRRMFPSVRVRVSGLEPDSTYFVFLEIALASGDRFKFCSQDWGVVGAAEPQSPPSTRVYIHPESPATGASWMAQDIMFHRAKLTNSTLDRSGNIVLTSMHKYQPRVHIVKASDILAVHWSPTATFTFPQTQFIAVTAYQNEKITKLKIDNNPFAKGFRENGLAKIKRKLQKDPNDSSATKEEVKESPLKRHDEGSVDEDECLAKKTCPSEDSGLSSGSPTPPLSPQSVSSYSALVSMSMPPPPFPPFMYPMPSSSPMLYPHLLPYLSYPYSFTHPLLLPPHHSFPFP